MKSKFIIFSQSRSGSTLLKELIDSHPKILCEDEIFNLDEGYVESSFFLEVWKKMPYPFIYYRRFLSLKQFYGFTLFNYHFSKIGRAIRLLNSMGWKIIYLERKDIITQTLSVIVATKTDHWHNYGDSSEKTESFSIPVERFLKEIKKRLRWHKREADIVQAIPHFTVCYEHHLQNKSDWQNSLNQVFQYLGAEEAPVQSNLKKMYPKPYSELIENYEELINALKKSEIKFLLERADYLRSIA